MKPISCTICGNEHTSDNYYKLCPGCLHELNELRHEKLNHRQSHVSFRQVSEEAFEEVQTKFRRGEMKPMKTCECCGQKVHTLTDHIIATAHGLKLCTTCFSKAHTKWVVTDDLTFPEVVDKLRIGKENTKRAKQIYEETTGEDIHDETFEVVRVRKKPLSEEEYFDMEYHFLNLDVIEGESRADELNRLLALADIALMTKDIPWLKDLHQQMQRVKGENK